MNTYDYVYPENTIKSMEKVSKMSGGCVMLQGIKGLGKRTAADIIAADALSRNLGTVYTSPDCFLLEPEDNVIKVERISELHNFLSFKAAENNKKIVVIDDADSMTGAAQNAVLKLFEEKSENNLFLLVVHTEMLPTIESRSSKITFSPLSDENMKTALKGQEVDKTVLLLAGGRPGIYNSFKEKTEFMEDVNGILNVLSTMKDTRQLFEAFHLVKEKDKDMFYEKYPAEYVTSFLQVLKEEVFLKAVCCDYSELADLNNIRSVYAIDHILRILDALQESILKMRKKGAFNKNDFFDLVRVMI